MKKWTIEDSRELYNINGWGTSYFGVNDRGDMYVSPCKDNVQIDLRDVMDELQLRDVTPPVLLRFPDILDNRIEKTSSCFKKAAEEYQYKGENFIVYPIKVNQMTGVWLQARATCCNCRTMPKRLYHSVQWLQRPKLYRTGIACTEDGQAHIPCC